MKRKTGWAEALAHALECEGTVSIDDLAAAIAPGPRQRDSIVALTDAAKAAITSGQARLCPSALAQGAVVLRSTRS